MHRARRRARSHLSSRHHCCPRSLLYHGCRPCTVRSVIRIPGPPRHLACPHACGGGARGAAGYIIRRHGVTGDHRRPRDLRRASPALRHARSPCAHASTVVVWSAPLAAAATPLLRGVSGSTFATEENDRKCHFCCFTARTFPTPRRYGFLRCYGRLPWFIQCVEERWPPDSGRCALA